MGAVTQPLNLRANPDLEMHTVLGEKQILEKERMFNMVLLVFWNTMIISMYIKCIK
jgi:hypothetical protein